MLCDMYGAKWDGYMFEVFVRDWYKFDDAGRRIPYPDAPKTFMARAYSEDEARQLCKDYNDVLRPNDVSRKAEYRRL